MAKLEISGIRGFDGPRTVDLDFTRPDGTHAGWTVLAGRNGSGKSTLLQAVALALLGPGNSGAIRDVDSWGDATLEKDNQLLISISTDDRFDPRGGDDAQLRVKWNCSFSDETVALWSSEGSTGEVSSWTTRPDGWFYTGYGPFRRHSYPDVGLGGPEAPRRFEALRTLFDEDATLVEGVSWLIGQHLLRLEEKPGAAELIRTVLAFLADGLLPDGFQVCKVDSRGLWVTRDGREFPLRQMSDGYRTVTALVVDIVRRMHAAYGTLEIEERDGTPTLPYPGIVLIDEVDAHLHVSWQQKIGGWLKAHFPAMQFIVTTHSPYICQSADPGGLIRLSGPDEQEPPRVVGEVERLSALPV
ncbi:AAA family ATPase [Actinomadura craniellae]|uniref:AAA family ATPase n=1 Tax=Actinomadura craniellae TaxID=2231787 RepID=UPI001F333789|nr:AAA family ATPase [Actinomadura craniellae]